MSKPIILTVDDEPQVLGAINRDLRTHFQDTYRIMRATNGAEALDVVRRLKQRGDIVALFLADERMPQMTGTQFLVEAKRYYPQARKVLLTAYSDTEAAIRSINEIDLDYYLLKPWHPPEQVLYPVLDDLLDEWWRNVPVEFDGIRVAGTLWSASSHRVKDFLSRNRIPYQWLDIERDEEARLLVEDVHQTERGLPVIFLPSGETLVDPDLATLAAAIGMQTTASGDTYDLVVIGAGPSGLGAAVYGGSEGLKTLMIEKAATGGQAGTSSRIENYLGFPRGVSGSELASRATMQARRFGVEILSPREVCGVRVEQPYKYIMLEDGTEVACKALMISTGVTVRRLPLPGIEPLEGAGVYYGAAMTEAANYRDQHVYIVGGANSAGQGAMFFSRYASQVTMLVRGSTLASSMSSYLIDQIAATPNIDVLTYTEVTAVRGEQKLEGLTLHNRQDDTSWDVETPAMFIFIGAAAHTDFLEGIVERTPTGFIITGQDLLQGDKPPRDWLLRRQPYMLETSVPGIFAVGDVRHGSVKRVASAVGEGAIGVSLVHQYLKSV